MADNFYPFVDIEFIKLKMLASGKLAKDGTLQVGSTITFIIDGPQAIWKRTIMVRELRPGQICYEQATGLASRFMFMGALLEWLQENRSWKEGAYIESQKVKEA